MPWQQCSSRRVPCTSSVVPSRHQPDFVRPHAGQLELDQPAIRRAIDVGPRLPGIFSVTGLGRKNMCGKLHLSPAIIAPLLSRASIKRAILDRTGPNRQDGAAAPVPIPPRPRAVWLTMNRADRAVRSHGRIAHGPGDVSSPRTLMHPARAAPVQVFSSIGVTRWTELAVTVISNSTNFGFPAAVNQGLREGRGEYLVLLDNDNDVVVTDGGSISLWRCRMRRPIGWSGRAWPGKGDLRPAVGRGREFPRQHR